MEERVFCSSLAFLRTSHLHSNRIDLMAPPPGPYSGTSTLALVHSPYFLFSVCLLRNYHHHHYFLFFIFSIGRLLELLRSPSELFMEALSSSTSRYSNESLILHCIRSSGKGFYLGLGFAINLALLFNDLISIDLCHREELENNVDMSCSSKLLILYLHLRDIACDYSVLGA